MEDMEKLRLYQVNKVASDFFGKMLFDEAGKSGLDYFKERGLTDTTIKKQKLGYAPSNPALLVDYLYKKGFTDKELLNAGLVNEGICGQISKFQNRVMFPIIDYKGNILGFGGRIIENSEKAKYLNTPETDIFHKRQLLYGFSNALRTHKPYILCEGYMDVITLNQAGFSEAVAPLGTAFTPESAITLQRFSPNLYLCFDNDTAGIEATVKAIKMLKRFGIRTIVIDLSPYKDPDEFIKNSGAKEFKKRMDNF